MYPYYFIIYYFVNKYFLFDFVERIPAANIFSTQCGDFYGEFTCENNEYGIVVEFFANAGTSYYIYLFFVSDDLTDASVTLTAECMFFC